MEQKPSGIPLCGHERHLMRDRLESLFGDESNEIRPSSNSNSRAGSVAVLSAPWTSLIVPIIVAGIGWGAGWGLAIEFRGKSIDAQARADEQKNLRHEAELVAERARTNESQAMANQKEAERLTAVQELAASKERAAAEELARWKQQAQSEHAEIVRITDEQIHVVEDSISKRHYFDAVIELWTIGQLLQKCGEDRNKYLDTWVDQVNRLIATSTKDQPQDHPDGATP